MKDGKLKHFDNGKPRVDLIPGIVLMAIGMVMGFGAKKYGDNNWKKGTTWKTYYASTLRHLYAWEDGEDIDPDSNLPHLSHALCDIIYLLWYYLKRVGVDNRKGDNE